MHGSSSLSGANLLRELRRVEEGYVEGDVSSQLIRRLKRRKHQNTSNINPSLDGKRMTQALAFINTWGTDDDSTLSEHTSKTTPPTRHSSAPDTLPPHLMSLRSGLEYLEMSKIRVPLVRALSPRSVKRAARLPPPNAAENLMLQEIDTLELSPSKLFDSLSRSSDKRVVKQQRRRLNTPDVVNTSIVSSPQNFNVSLSSTSPIQSAKAQEIFLRVDRVKARKEEINARLQSTAYSLPHAGGGEASTLDGLVADVFDTLGVDLDENFNKARRLGKAVAVVGLLWSRLHARAAFDRFKLQVQLASDARRLSATINLQRVGRGFLSRMYVREMLENLRAQQAEDLARRKRAARKAIVAAGLTLWLESRLLAQVMRMRNQRNDYVANIIQRAWRSYAARSAVNVARIERIKRYNAAVMLQRTIRRVRARRKVAVIRAIRRVVRIQQLRLIKEEARLAAYYGALKRAGAALIIKRGYRSSVLRYRLHTMVYWNRVEKSMIIQKSVRGYLERLKHRTRVAVALDSTAKQRIAAITIQRYTRGHLQRNKFHQMVRDFGPEVRRKNRILEKLQMAIRNRKPLKKFYIRLLALFRRLEPFRYVRLRKAALNIQRVYRGHYSRKTSLLTRINSILRLRRQAIERPRKAAILIQRTIRGYLVRKKIKRVYVGKRAVIIQCFWRKTLAIEKLELLSRQRKAALILR